MKLVPISPQHLRIDIPLPFSVYDAQGGLVLPAGRQIGDRRHLQELAAQPLFADESDATEWMRGLADDADALLSPGAARRPVATAAPEAGRESGRPAPVALGGLWWQIADHLGGALGDIRRSADWRTRFMTVHLQARQLAQLRPDAALYYLVYEAGHSYEKYSCKHALLTLVICELAAPLLGWEPAWVDSLGRAALTMNVAMMRQQDLLAVTKVKPDAALRAFIDGHASAGALMLEEGKFPDPLAIQVVALHHDDSGADLPLLDLAPERQLARLLRRVDIFAAKISCRANRAPRSPVQAAAEACLGPSGVPDEIGAALLKAVGMYPPGSYVELASGEIGIVAARGRRANQPYVAALVSARGSPLGDPELRDTADRGNAITGSLAPAQVRVVPPHERLMALR